MIISFVVRTLGAIMAMPYYTDSKYFCLWSEIMMPSAGMPPLSFTIYSLVFAFLTGVIFASFYGVVERTLTGRGIRKGMVFGLWLFAVVGITGFMGTYLVLSVPLMLLIMWQIESLVLYLIAGIIFSKIIRT